MSLLNFQQFLHIHVMDTVASCGGDTTRRFFGNQAITQCTPVPHIRQRVIDIKWLTRACCDFYYAMLVAFSSSAQFLFILVVLVFILNSAVADELFVI
jgi:hypothetical protein